MCGIVGQYNPRGGDLDLVTRMVTRLVHRGPDGCGTYRHGPLAFGAARLAIIDLAAGAMPIFNEDRSVAVVYNGEIYNYRALRAELERAGHVFATYTDTEVLVHGYEAWGEDVVNHLRGMFALCIWDQVRERILLARDRLGEKPLYYAQVGEAVLFASEIKALLEDRALPRRVDADALLHFLALGYVPPPLTMFDGVRKLAAGERLVVDRAGLRVDRFYTPPLDTVDPLPGSRAALAAQVRDRLVEAVEMRMMSDVPIGVFLSGGVDSTAVAAIMSRASRQPIQAFTVEFEMAPGSGGEGKFNVDARYAHMAAEQLGAQHHIITVHDSELPRLLPHLVAAMDEPVAQPSMIPTVYVAALARLSGVPVLLSGDGSDELFGGYPAYRADRILGRYLGIPGIIRQTVLTPVLERLRGARLEPLRKLAQKSRWPGAADRFLAWNHYFEPERIATTLCSGIEGRQIRARLAATLEPVLAVPRAACFTDRLAYGGLRLWLAEDSNMRVDKMTMAMSVEARAPFEDHPLVEMALRIALEHKLHGGGSKVVLKEALRGLVPESVLTRPKWGFIPPMSNWLRTAFRPLVETVLAPERVAAAGWCDPAAVTRLVDDHMTRRSYELWTVWPLLVFHLWHALMIEGSMTLDHTLAPEDFAHLVVA